MSSPDRLTLRAVPDLPLLKPGDDLAALIATAMERAAIAPADGDVLVVAQKAVSKAEGRYVDLATVVPSARASRLAREVQQDPRMVEVILSEATCVVRHGPRVLIVEHRLGYVMANAGVDRSNVSPTAGAEPVILLPRDPDATAESLRGSLAAHFGKRLAVIVNDSFGRAWRNGTVGVALGAAGLESLKDHRDRPDLYGRALRVSQSAVADELAAAASLLMGQADEGFPVILVSGLDHSGVADTARSLLRDRAQDLFR
jgi:coenzyme F420-0:L-glutamate ligase/coenzyme F420-1:gamma-L-glutamate ligase